jgi:hypothetical protein
MFLAGHDARHTSAASPALSWLKSGVDPLPLEVPTPSRSTSQRDGSLSARQGAEDTDMLAYLQSKFAVASERDEPAGPEDDGFAGLDLAPTSPQPRGGAEARGSLSVGDADAGIEDEDEDEEEYDEDAEHEQELGFEEEPDAAAERRAAAAAAAVARARRSSNDRRARRAVEDSAEDTADEALRAAIGLSADAEATTDTSARHANRGSDAEAEFSQARLQADSHDASDPALGAMAARAPESPSDSPRFILRGATAMPASGGQHAKRRMRCASLGLHGPRRP